MVSLASKAPLASAASSTRLSVLINSIHVLKLLPLVFELLSLLGQYVAKARHRPDSSVSGRDLEVRFRWFKAH